jgi:5-methyltetrahydrofolate corrinoid/iron sulfur protein methyltransferase
MILVGEELNVMSKKLGQAIKDRDAGPIRECVAEQVKNKMDYLDLNVGPVKKDPVGTIEWLIETVQAVTDVPLCLDTTNVAAMEAGIKLCKKKPILNSASGSTESRQTMMPLAAKYPCNLVLSVIDDKGLPSDADARAASIMDSVAYANELGIVNEDIWVDPVMMPVSVDQRQIAAYMEFLQMLPDIVPGAKSLCGLSNLSFGVPKELRGLLNRTLLVMIDRLGQHSAIVSGYDEELTSLIRGGMPNIVKLIHQTMDSEDIDLSSLSEKERQYVKTAEVLMGRSLFSSSWLEV